MHTGFRYLLLNPFGLSFSFLCLDRSVFSQPVVLPMNHHEIQPFFPSCFFCFGRPSSQTQVARLDSPTSLQTPSACLANPPYMANTTLFPPLFLLPFFNPDTGQKSYPGDRGPGPSPRTPHVWRFPWNVLHPSSENATQTFPSPLSPPRSDFREITPARGHFLLTLYDRTKGAHLLGCCLRWMLLPHLFFSLQIPTFDSSSFWASELAPPNPFFCILPTLPVDAPHLDFI